MKTKIILLLQLVFLLLVAVNCSKKEEEQPAEESCRDINGNEYLTIKIGSQVWMAENLRTTHYRNGDKILYVSDSQQWDNLTTGAYTYYNNEEINMNTYGCLYNWHVANDSRNIAPEGWHVPTEAEWITLINYLQGSGGKMKEEGTTHWQSPNTGATNESGFTALPGGQHIGWGFYHLGTNGYWWSVTEYDSTSGINLTLYHDNSDWWLSDFYKTDGFSIRCIMD